jgi:selT/selW/selH-like putative selenoprotein
LPRATSLAAELETKFGAQVELQPGAKGAFEVRVDGRLVFSKTALHRFPETTEIEAHLR